MEQQKTSRTHDYFVQAPPSLIDTKELSRLLNISRGTLYNWVWKRRIPFLKVGRCLRFDYQEVLAAQHHFAQEISQ
jgi:excisionase family DNA binding protein